MQRVLTVVGVLLAMLVGAMGSTQLSGTYTRESRTWGRLYLHQWPQTIQYYRANFGGEIPLGERQFVFSRDDGCNTKTGEEEKQSIVDVHGEGVEGKVVILHRGNCSFGVKAKNAQNSGASAVLIINNEEGLEHLEATDGDGLAIAVASITKVEGGLLEKAIKTLGIRGYLVPIACEKAGTVCDATTIEERKWIAEMNFGGLLHLSSSPHSETLQLEYLLAKFGVQLPERTVSLPFVQAEPEEACDAITNDVAGKAVLVRRGSCDFFTKAMAVQQAGGKVILVGNNQPNIVRMSMEPRHKGLAITIPLVMLSQRSFDIVRHQHPLTLLSFATAAAVNASAWETLERAIQTGEWTTSTTNNNNNNSGSNNKRVKLSEEEAEASFLSWTDRAATVQLIRDKFPSAWLPLEPRSNTAAATTTTTTTDTDIHIEL